MKGMDVLLRLQRMRTFMLRGEYGKAYKVLLEITDAMVAEERSESYRAKCAEELRHMEVKR